MIYKGYMMKMRVVGDNFFRNVRNMMRHFLQTGAQTKSNSFLYKSRIPRINEDIYSELSVKCRVDIQLDLYLYSYIITNWI